MLRPIACLAVALVVVTAAPAAADQVAYTADGDVHVHETATGQSRAVTAGRDPSWGPSGGRLVLADHFQGRDEITSFTHDGRCRSVLVSAPGASQPALSDDGVRLLYVTPSGFGPLIHLKDLATGTDRVVAAGYAPRWQGGDAPHLFEHVQGSTIRVQDVNDPRRAQVVVSGLRGPVAFDADTHHGDWAVSDATGLARRRFSLRTGLDPAGANPSVLGFVTYYDAPSAGGGREVRMLPRDGNPSVVVARGADPEAAPSPSPGSDGYRIVAADGGVFTFGGRCFHGSTGDRRLNEPVVGMAETPTGDGYWLVARDGGVFTFGDARFHGSAVGLGTGPVVGIAPTASGRGYWVLYERGGVFAFGDAAHFGSIAGNEEGATAIVPTTTARGYWVVTPRGRVHAFGDAAVRAEQVFTDSPIVDAARVGQDGLVLLGQGGGVFALGTDFRGSYHSAPRRVATRRFVGIRSTDAGNWLVSDDGSVFSFGDARFYGSLGAVRLNQPVVGA